MLFSVMFHMCTSRAKKKHVTISQLSANIEEAKTLIEQKAGKWAIVGLASQAAIKANGYGWPIYAKNEYEPKWEDLGHYLCINTTISKTMNTTRILEKKSRKKI